MLAPRISERPQAVATKHGNEVLGNSVRLKQKGRRKKEEKKLPSTVKRRKGEPARVWNHTQHYTGRAKKEPEKSSHRQRKALHLRDSARQTHLPAKQKSQQCNKKPKKAKKHPRGGWATSRRMDREFSGGGVRASTGKRFGTG